MTIDEFSKVELKIAKVLEVEKVEGSEKLLKLQVDLGSEKRQILSGIAKSYLPEDLIGKEVVIVANLDSRQMMGFESQGMILAAVGEEGKPVVLIPEQEVSPGSEVK